MVAFLALLAEATNAVSAAVIVSCLLLVTVLIMRYQHGDEGWGGSSVVRVQHRPVQVAVQKLFVPYTLLLVREDEEEAARGSTNKSTSSTVTRVRLRCGAVGRGVLVRWWWGVQREALLPLLHAPWRSHHATVCDSSALLGCCGGSLELEEGSHTVLLELPGGRPMGLGSVPRDGYPLVVVQLDPADQDEDQYKVGSVVSLLHVPDAACPEAARMLYQYLKQRTGQLTLVTTLYTQANGVEPTATEHTTSPPVPSTIEHTTSPPRSSPEQTTSSSTNETVDTLEESRCIPSLQPLTASCDEVLVGSSNRGLSDCQERASAPPVTSSEDLEEGDVTVWEWQCNEDKELEQELKDEDTNCFNAVRDNRPVIEEVVCGEETIRCGSGTAGNDEDFVGSDTTSYNEGCSSTQSVRKRLVLAGEEILVDDYDHRTIDVPSVSCIQSLRLIDGPDDQSTRSSKHSSKEAKCSAASGADIDDSFQNEGSTKDSRQVLSTAFSSVGPEEGSCSGTSIPEAGAKSTLTEQQTDEDNTSAVPVEEAEDRPFSSSDCVVCQECRTSLALLPCRHVCVCYSCFDQLMASPQQACPLCRQRVQAYFEV